MSMMAYEQLRKWPWIDSTGAIEFLSSTMRRRKHPPKRRRGERRRGEDGERGRGEDGEREEGEEARRERRQAASACSLTLPSGSKDTEEAQALEETQGKILETWALESGVVKF